jgi:hypothetical protein
MAFLKDFVDPAGNMNTAAYWRADELTILSAKRLIGLKFVAYKDANAFTSGLAPLAGSEKQYAVNGSAFLTIAFSPPNGASLYDVLANACENYALAKLDTPTGEHNEDGSPVLVSFFAGATQV